MKNITEQESHYNNLEQLSVGQLIAHINNEDQTVAPSVRRAAHQLEALIQAIVERMESGGRLFYIGAGTSGRLGILDASECPPTYGVPPNLVFGLIAGGDAAIRNPVEHAEDNDAQAFIDLQACAITPKDCVLGIAASGATPYVLGGLRQAKALGCLTGCIVCNANSPIAAEAQFPVEIITGPEFVTGSTRMKAGTATKMALNTISTATMIRLGRVKGNKMIDMQLSNAKLRDRGIRMVMAETAMDYATAQALLEKHRSVRRAIEKGSVAMSSPSRN